MNANDVLAFREPILLSKLRVALAHLYGIGAANAVHNIDAHSYLVEFQARNTRRKAIALQQRQNDKNDGTSSALLPREEEYIGSSFYACLPSLLLSIPSHDTERLFSAQSILHRLRRMKLSEAIDFEIECHHEQNSIMSVETVMHMTSGISIPSQEQTLYWTQFLHFHCESLSSFHTVLLGKVLERYSQQWSENMGQHFNIRSAADLEEKIKGEITLYILATAAYLNGYVDVIQESNEEHSTIGPLLHTLTSAMAVTALRLRYTPSDPSSPTTQTPIVSQVVNSFQVVFEIATSLSLQELMSGFNLPIVKDHNLLNFLQQHNSLIHTRALSKCVCISLASVPDAILGSEGGARGRLSIDPRCIQSTNVELRTFDTGIGLLQQTIMQLNAVQMENDTSANSQRYLKEQILGASERWARFVPLTHEFVEAILTTAQTDLSTLEQINKHDTVTSYDRIYFQFLTRIFEAASVTPEEIIAISAGLTLDSGSQQSGRKRQSSKSKKRHKQKLLEVIESGGEKSSDIRQEDANSELRLRGSVASYAARIAWEKIYPLYKSSLTKMDASPNTVVEGEGVIGCICTCVSACLPHYINYGAPQADPSMILVGLLFEALKEVCSSSNPSVRALSFEHIIAVHKALVNVQPIQDLDDLYFTIAQSLSDCSLTLSEKCGYPNTYFEHMEWNNVEELEIERNDVRDIIRAICSFDFGVEEFSRFSVACLVKTINFCYEGIMNDRSSLLPPETLVHVLSSPAKSIHVIAMGMVSGKFRDKLVGESIITKALDALYRSCACLKKAFQEAYPFAQTLPISRLVTIIIASFSPIFASIVENKASFSEELFVQLEQTIGIGLQIICESLLNIPELVAASTLDVTSYDIRGAMRSPGGEDHCSCIALMRLVRDSDCLTQAIIPLSANHFKKSRHDVLMDIVNVYTHLYTCEQQRPPGQMHGKGVTPKSRRVFLNAMTKLGLSTLKNDPSSADHFVHIFGTIFEKSIDTVVSSHQRCDLSIAQRNYLICESCYDLAAFPSSFSKELFKESNPTWKTGIEIILDVLLSGYEYPVTGDSSNEGLAQWVRIRGGFLTLLRSCADPDLPKLATEATKNLIKRECLTVAHHFSQMNQCESSIFNEPNICEETLSGGAFIIVIRDILTKINHVIDEGIPKEYFCALEGCLDVMEACKEDIYSVINLRGSLISSGWEDPRMPTAEAWYLSLSELISVYKNLHLNYDERMCNLVCETVSVTLYLTLSRRVEKEAVHPISVECMSLDGPVTLALIDFLGDAISLGHLLFSRIGNPFVDKVTLENGQACNDLNLFGCSMLAAALYHGSSGAFPPWFVESVPLLFEALFNACADIDAFMAVLKTGAELIAHVDIGFVPAGSKLAGYYFNVTKVSAKEEFFNKTAELAKSTEGNRWRRMKVLLKAICGGKKKSTDFNLKPQPSSWECERI